MALTTKQRVKVNAALSMIHTQGYDAQTVVRWAKEYERTGYDTRRAYEQALNEFAAGQPDIGNSIGKIARLVEASSVRTVAQYDEALSAFIATGDSTAIDALAPMIAADSVALAVQNGELPQGSLTAEGVEAALGFAMDDATITAAAPQQPAQAPQAFAFNTGKGTAEPDAMDPTASQVSPYAGAGRQTTTDRWQAAPSTGAGSARGLLGGHTLGNNGLSDRPAQPAPMTKAQIVARHTNQGASFPAETV